jgi:hypothetical protein
VKCSQSQCGNAINDKSDCERLARGTLVTSGITLIDGVATIDLPERTEKTKWSDEPVWVSDGAVNINIAARLSKSAVCSFTNSSIASAIATPKNAMSESVGNSINTILASVPNNRRGLSVFSPIHRPMVVVLRAYPKRGLTLFGEAVKPMKSTRLQRVRPLLG